MKLGATPRDVQQLPPGASEMQMRTPPVTVVHGLAGRRTALDRLHPPREPREPLPALPQDTDHTADSGRRRGAKGLGSFLDSDRDCKV
jgi:hypothetical protein